MNSNVENSALDQIDSTLHYQTSRPAPNQVNLEANLPNEEEAVKADENADIQSKFLESQDPNASQTSAKQKIKVLFLGDGKCSNLYL